MERLNPVYVSKIKTVFFLDHDLFLCKNGYQLIYGMIDLSHELAVQLVFPPVFGRQSKFLVEIILKPFERA